MSSNLQEIILPEPPTVPSTHGSGWTAGFLVLGSILGCLGSLLIAWNYHMETAPVVIGTHFLALNGGYVLGNLFSRRMLEGRGLRRFAVWACCAGALSLAGLGILGPPLDPAWRILTLVPAGASAGLLASSLLGAGARECTQSLGTSASRCGVLFGFGCLLGTVIVGLTYVLDAPRSAPFFLAAVPVVFIGIIIRKHWPSLKAAQTQAVFPPVQHSSVAAALLGLLLFFQSGSEWAIAGWLPLFLVRTLGSSPAAAIFGLALFFAVLMVSRALAQQLVSFLGPGRLLIASIAVVVTGYLILSLSRSLPDANTGILLTAFGFGPIYPAISQYVRQRLTYGAREFNRLLTAGVAGAMIAPWLLGFVDEWLGIRAVLVVPAFGSIAVMVLALLFILESRLMGFQSQ